MFKQDRGFGGSRGVRRVDSGSDAIDAFHFAREASVYGGEVERMYQSAVSALGLSRGWDHIEFAFTRRGPRLLELGARCDGGHISQIVRHVTGVDEFIEACRMACGQPPGLRAPIRRLGAEYRFLVFAPGRVAAWSLLEAVRRHPSIIDADLTASPGDEIRPLQTTAQRAGFVAAAGACTREARQSADWACAQIEMTYRNGRRRRCARAELLKGRGLNISFLLAFYG